jgi:hypothetical protein
MGPKELTEDLGALREDLGQVKEKADEKLAQAEADRPELAWLLDVRVVLASAAISLLIAFVARLAGLPFLLALLLFLILFGALWTGISRAGTPRRSAQSD